MTPAKPLFKRIVWAVTLKLLPPLIGYPTGDSFLVAMHGSWLLADRRQRRPITRPSALSRRNP
jgi:hypothetical protein